LLLLILDPIGQNLSEAELDRINQNISKKIVASREALLVTTILQGQIVLRMCLINPRTTIKDIQDTLEQCELYGKEELDNMAQNKPN
jgi:glutamate/tyrosine decarboxylase-like PLP-dependent enzyme